MGDMTSTDELRRLLDERGVEYEVDDAKTVRVTRWRAYGDWVSFIEYDNGDTKFCIDARRLTPEQAIAATLGHEPDDAAMVRLHDQMNATMLKYEMAQGIEKRDVDAAIVVPWVAKMHALLEEAAMLGASDAKPTQAESLGTCEMEYVSDWMSWHCKACDQMDMAPRNPKPRYCKWCGRKVVGE